MESSAGGAVKTAPYAQPGSSLRDFVQKIHATAVKVLIYLLHFPPRCDRIKWYTEKAVNGPPGVGMRDAERVGW